MTGRVLSERQRSLTSVFLVAMFGVSFETFLTRFFAVALFSEYSYWIISMAMLGYAIGGVLLAIAPQYFKRNRQTWLFLIPPLLLAASILAFIVLRLNPFNPLKLQNEVLWQSQIPDILLYYAGLAPVFLLAGMFIGLNFLIYQRRVSIVYALDLFGAALGSALILALMFLVHPYHLPALMLVVLFALAVFNAPRVFHSLASGAAIAYLAGVAALSAFGLSLVLSVSTLYTPDFKPLFPVLGISGTRIERTLLSPSGTYVVADDYLEFDNVNMTNNYSYLKLGSPPRSYGLYRDGIRIAPLLKRIPQDLSYVRGSLSYLPYLLRPGSSALVIGTSGGYKLVDHAGVSGVVGLEQQRAVYSLVRDALAAAHWKGEARGKDRLVHGSVFGYLSNSRARFGIIEMAWGFLGEARTNRYAYTKEALQLYLRSLRPGGVIAIPVDISDVTLYALKTVNTATAALEAMGVSDPAGHIMCYRSEWTAEVLVSNRSFTGADVEALKSFCWDRSFDTSYYPGIDPATVSVWNDLPPVSFQGREVRVSRTAQDSLMQDLVRLLSAPRESPPHSGLFNLSPSTLDKPDFFSISRPSRIGTLFSRVSLLPQPEMSYLVNVIVLGQAFVLALIILLLPLARRHRSQALPRAWGTSVRSILYFGALGLGFFFIELALIDKLSFLLGSDTASFGIVLSAMLVFSGLGSWYSARFVESPFRGLLGALALIGASVLFFLVGLDPLMQASVGLPFAVRAALAILVVAPLSFGLGRPFPLGMSALRSRSDFFIPWAWAINGGLSVLATPLANLLSASIGWSVVLAAALLLYASTPLTFPARRREAESSQVGRSISAQSA